VDERPRSRLQQLPPWLVGLLAVGLVALIGAAAAAGNPVASSPFEPKLGLLPPATTPNGPIDQRPVQSSDTGSWLGYVIGGLVLLAIVVVLVTFFVLIIRMFSGRHNGLLRRRVLEPDEIDLLVTPLPDVDLLGVGTPVADAVRDGLVDIVSGHDVRAAIIGAWLRLEDAAAVVGTPRRDTDAPGDLVQRVLAAHAIGPARLEELAELYRRARFSHAALGERDRTAAIQALSAVRGALLGEPVSTADAGSDTGKWPTRWN
jgi:hypothetical protein